MKTVKFLLTDQTGEVMGERVAVMVGSDTARDAIKRKLHGEEILSMQNTARPKSLLPSRWLVAIKV
jgi:ribosomal protein S28E/S33